MATLHSMVKYDDQLQKLPKLKKSSSSCILQYKSIMEVGVNQLVYGTQLRVKVHKQKSEYTVFLCPADSRLIRLVNFTKNDFLCLDMTEIASILDPKETKLSVRTRNGNVIKLYLKDADELTSICQGLHYLMNQAMKIEEDLNSHNAVWSQALKLMHKGDMDLDQQINFKEFQHLIGELQINLTEMKTISLFKKYAQNDFVNEAAIYEIILLYSRKEELYDLYLKYSSQKQEPLFADKYSAQMMKGKDLEDFFLIEQGQPYVARKTHYTFYEFQNIIYSADNGIFQHQTLDLSHPMVHYYINSSHNTYIEGNQLAGQSSIQAYIDAFMLGSKCVELDCWNGPNGEPVITHGHTLLNNILFRDVIQCVKEYGFYHDSFPVILSLEMHCNVQQQDRIAEILIEVLQNQLFIIQDFTTPTYPLLKDMLNKVIIKNKCDNAYLDSKMAISTITQASNTIAKEDTLLLFEDFEQQQKVLSASMPTESVGQHHSKHSMKLMEITSMYGGIKLDLNKRFIWGIASISEATINKLKHKQADLVRGYSDTCFLRSYPAGFRFDSSNYNPCPSWEIGAQMVALNIQTKDVNMLINYGRFLNSNYVLKQQSKPISIQLTIVSAQNLTWEDKAKRQEEVVDPYIKVRLAGHAEDEHQAEKWRTTTVQDNGIHPIFNYTCNIKVEYSQLAIIYFQAYSYSLLGDSLLGQYALPLVNLKRGYRVVPMLNSKLQLINNSYVLVYTKYIH